MQFLGTDHTAKARVESSAFGFAICSQVVDRIKV